MSIQSEITRISGNISSSLTKVASKGVTVPSGSNSDDLPDLIDLIVVDPTYSISKTLNNVTSSADDTKVIAGNSFFTELTPASGYVISSITVTMGGVDVTDQVFKPGTGAKSITANGTYAASSDNLSGYSAVVVNVPSGGADLGTKTITQNGTYNASSDNLDGYSQVTADVPNTYVTGDEGKVVSNGALVAQSSDTVTQNGIVDTTLINSLTVNVSGGGEIPSDENLYKFVKNTLTELIDDDGEITSITNYGVYQKTALTNARLMGCTTIGSYCFNGCSNIETIVLPAFTGNLSNREFQNCGSLTAIDLGGGNKINFSGTNNPPWLNDANFNKLIIRKTGSIMQLSPASGTASTFNGTPFASSGSGGTLYVPSALVDSYKNGTNWKTWFADGGSHNNTVTAIEGSYYETHYADGTAIS